METATHGRLKQARIEISAYVASPASDLMGNATKCDRTAWTCWLEESAREVFELMVNISISPRDAVAGGQAFDLCAMVGLAGEICGVLSLRCSGACGQHIASTMLGTDVSEGDSNVLDAFGEVCNMIAGSFKAKIPGLSDGCMLSVPTVINGRNYVVHSLGESERIVVCVGIANHPLTITLDLHSPLLS